MLSSCDGNGESVFSLSPLAAVVVVGDGTEQHPPSPTGEVAVGKAYRAPLPIVSRAHTTAAPYVAKRNDDGG